MPVVPDTPRLRIQAVHADDVADAYRRAALSDVRGAFNLAADPVLDAAAIAEILHARTVAVPARALRAAASLAFALRLSPTEPGWLDLALGVPLMSSERARAELGWRPVWNATDALTQLLDGLRDGDEGDTPPLARSTSGLLRWRELATGMGQRP